jgi:hypothetical protein
MRRVWTDSESGKERRNSGIERRLPWTRTELRPKPWRDRPLSVFHLHIHLGDFGHA